MPWTTDVFGATLPLDMPPTLANGKICYVEIPALDVPRSAEFYERVFGWQTRKRGDDEVAFDDSTGQVSGTWVAGRPPMGEVGLLIYITVSDAAASVAKIVANGGDIVQEIGRDAPVVTARFRDPAGNVLGIYQQEPEAAG